MMILAQFQVFGLFELCDSVKNILIKNSKISNFEPKINISWQPEMKNWVDYKKVYTFILALDTFKRMKLMVLPSKKNGKYFTGLQIFCPTKIRFKRYRRFFCGKLEAAVHSCFVEGKLFSKLFSKITIGVRF